MSTMEDNFVDAPARRNPFVWPALLLLVLVALGYFGYKRLQTPPAAMPPQSAVPVGVVEVKSAPIEVWSSFSARTRAVNEAEIRPEVSGRITEIRFQDGQEVKAGDILLVIDPRPYQAALERARASLATAQTNNGYAQTEMSRAGDMIKTQAIAQKLYDQRANESRVANAAVQAAEADVQTAALNVEHAFVRAPISGRAGRTELTVGNLVEAGPGAPLLTSVVSTGAIYADFEVNEQTYMQAIHGKGAAAPAAQKKIPVQLMVGDTGGKVYDGTIYAFDNHIDSATGTIRARAKFENDGGALVPGMFVSVRLAGAQAAAALLVPQVAIGTDQDKKFVYTVGPDNKAVYAAVTLGNAVGEKQIVLSGLKDGDKVIVDGVQHVQPGAPVAATPVAATPVASNTASPAPASETAPALTVK